MPVGLAAGAGCSNVKTIPAALASRHGCAGRQRCGGLDVQHRGRIHRRDTADLPDEYIAVSFALGFTVMLFVPARVLAAHHMPFQAPLTDWC